MNVKDAIIKDVVEIARNFDKRELAALQAYIRALGNGKTPDEAFKAGEAVRTGKENLKEIGETDTPFYRQLSDFVAKN